MEFRQLGRSGLKIPVLSLGTATFGGSNEFFRKWGDTDVAQASRMVDVCLDHGVTLFDTADIYSAGTSEEVLGQALKGRRDRVMISSKATFPTGDGPNDMGSSRYHLVRACEASLKRLGTDHIDLYFMHGFDALTPVDETLRALDDLIKAGKIGAIGASNFSGWHLMKSLATSERDGLARYVVYQGYYSLIGRDYEWELMPLGLDQGVGLMVWSPLGWGRLTGKIRRGQPAQSGRIASGGSEGGPVVDDESLYRVVDALDEIAAETGRSVPQVALNWLLQRPTVTNIVIGARNEEQLKQNLGAIGWSLRPEQIARLDDASHREPIYPYWHQKGFDERNPKPTRW
ncbi:oxidoreductase [Ameyamaea chiangmaiensis NBRC 103196]|uniref:Aldo/keto reductase n=1 Tax=Ameyamaea chiangmaiensis TaxID=442969 RepID=A0A850PBR5_9PROT|nr:aldo/keto reductase [Ameyamaea chiangmaiensis]MBS4075968.1 aldo/keto reductase [Ameyamaea chiangmaiensis]NVN39746.1 aldo/keto reductase [Ameyamaea chiangmaiensis]GBQ61583.1 oxidoreductase [Ameyamaea chiangmaiensis NBRC 103196]